MTSSKNSNKENNHSSFFCFFWILSLLLFLESFLLYLSCYLVLLRLDLVFNLFYFCLDFCILLFLQLDFRLKLILLSSIRLYFSKVVNKHSDGICRGHIVIGNLLIPQPKQNYIFKKIHLTKCIMVPL